MTSDSEIKRIKETLRQKVAGRECHTMADLIDGKIEPKVLQDWASSPLAQVYARKNTALADPIAGLIDLSSLVLDAVRPNATGRMIVNMHETTHDSVKIRIREKGKAAKTARGNGTVYSYAGRSKFIEIKPDQELGVEDGWSRNDLEDAEWNIESDAVMDLRADLMERETEEIIKKLSSVTNAQAAPKVNINPDSDFDADRLIEAWSHADQADQVPDCCIITKKALSNLLKDDDFKDSTLLGSFVNYSNGMVGQFLGMQMIVSTLHTAQEAYVINKARAIQYVLRRDSLLIPYENPPHDWMLNISMRYGMKFGDTKSIVPIRTT